MTDAPIEQPSLAEQIQQAVEKIAPNARAVIVEVDTVTNRVGAAVTMGNGATQGFRYEGPLGDAADNIAEQVRKTLAPK